MAPAASWRGYALAGYAVIALTFGVLGGGACFVRIDRAVVAPATVTVASNRKVVAHLEGGIIAEVLVHEGDRVVAGQRLFRLADVQARANADLLDGQLGAARALEARLVAERDHAEVIAWSPELLAMRDNPSTGRLVAQAMTDQAAQFQDRRRSLAGQANILRARITQMRLEIDGMKIERTATETQLGYIRTELVGVKQLLDEKLVQLTRVLALQREGARLEGVIGQLVTDAARTERAIGEADLQITQLQEHFQEDVATALADTRRQLGELREKRAVADDVLARVYVTAPIGGAVQAVRVGGAGQVIRPGEPLLEIVPTRDRLQIEAQFRPTDIADLKTGQQAEIRLPAFPARGLPLLLGRIESISQDRLIDEATHQPYFLGIVAVDEAALPPAVAAGLRAGMPAEVVVPTGERSVMSFLTDPLVNAMRRTMIEK
jgi:HlyD family secretion protein